MVQKARYSTWVIHVDVVSGTWIFLQLKKEKKIRKRPRRGF
jgi:general stress protein CsbA